MTNNVSSTKVHENLSLENLPNEIWKDIPEYEGYFQVSNLGRVKGIKRTILRNGSPITFQAKIRKQFTTKGYFTVALSKNGYQKQRQVHQLVAMAFLNHKPCGYKFVVDHKDNNSTNNHIDNLQIVTNRYNSSKDQKGHTSKYLGVSWREDRKKWRASIYHNGKNIELGHFNNQKEASKYYQNAVKAIKEGKEIKVKRKTSTSKHKGIYKKGNKWGLQIRGKYIGTFSTEQEALIYKNNLK